MKETEFEVHESFLGFIDVTDQSAENVTNVILKAQTDLNPDMIKLRGPGYDGAAVMKGAYGGVQKRISAKLGRSGPYIHCAAHKLNLVVNDAVGNVNEAVKFFDIIQSIFNYFGNNTLRWIELALNSDFSNPLKLQKLCPTRWSSRIHALRAVKNRYSDLLRVLSKICLETKKSVEVTQASGLRKKMETFEFVLMLVIWERILSCVFTVSSELQSKSMDLSIAVRLMVMARRTIASLRDQWSALMENAIALARTWGSNTSFKVQRIRKVKTFFDELASDHDIADPEKRFRVNTFYVMIDLILKQIDVRYASIFELKDQFCCLIPRVLLKMEKDELLKCARKMAEKYRGDIRFSLPDDLLSFREEFGPELSKCSSSASSLMKLLLELQMFSRLPEIGAACVLFLSFPVTVASAERSFSKLKLIKTYLRSSMSQESLSGLALMSIEREEVVKMDINTLIDQFAIAKSRRITF